MGLLNSGMSSTFQIGDRVQLLDEPLEGRVIAINDTTITFLSSDGFELEVAPADLIRLPDNAAREHLTGTVNPSLKEGDSPKRNNPNLFRKKKGQTPPVVVDLHAEKLFPKKNFPDAYEMLDRQIEEARRMLEFALRKRIQYLVFIHGVGTGVLKAELETLLRRYPEISFNQADYRTFGQGALEVFIPQSAFS